MRLALYSSLFMLLVVVELGIYFVGKKYTKTTPVYTAQEYVYHEQVQPILPRNKSFYQDKTAQLTVDKVFELLKLQGFYPLKDSMVEVLEPRSIVWVYLRVEEAELEEKNLICLRENLFTSGNPFKTTFYQIHQDEITFLAHSGGKCNRYRKHPYLKSNDCCVPFEQQKKGKELEFLVKVEKKRSFRQTIFPYLSNTKIENEFKVNKKFEQRHKRVFVIVFVSLLTYFFIYILIQYHYINDITYIWYAVYLLGLILYHGEQLDERFRVNWIFDNIVEWHDYFRAFAHTITGVAYTYFVIGFLNFKEKNLTTYHLINRLMYIIFVFPILTLLIGRLFDHILVNRFIRNYNILLIGIVIYILIAMLYSKKKQEPKYQRLYDYIIIGTIAIMIGGIVNYSLRYLDQTNLLSPTTIWGSKINYVRFGILIENICFMLGLSYKARLVIEEKAIYETKMKYFEKRTEELHQQAIRARIPAHTATNIMKEIKYLHEQKKHTKAEQYASLFSTFLREHYEQSFEKYIPLSRELNSIQRYIRLRSISTEKRVK
ncbi:MAG: 7TM diverse intracellular signaling domain-containing protein, partial [Bacteroidota bacterium]